jgi:quercetin dioxygenase-like cupin family protein
MSAPVQVTSATGGRSKPIAPGPKFEEVAPEVVDEALRQIVEENEKKRGAWVFPWEIILAYITHFGDWPAWSYVKRRQTQLSPPGQQGVWSSFLSIFGRAAKQDYHAHRFQSELFLVLAGTLRLRVEESGELVQYVLKRGDLAVIPPGVFHRAEVIKDSDDENSEEPAVLVVKSPNAHPDVPGYKLTKPLPVS